VVPHAPRAGGASCTVGRGVSVVPVASCAGVAVGLPATVLWACAWVGATITSGPGGVVTVAAPALLIGAVLPSGAVGACPFAAARNIGAISPPLAGGWSGFWDR